jgi:hypothetical protein
MNLPTRSFPRISLAAVCLAGISRAAFSQQTTPANGTNERFYAALADAANASDSIKTKKMGGLGGDKFIDVMPEGALLVGFEVWQGAPRGRMIIRGIRPIFETAKGRVPGTLHGTENGELTRVEAKEGYAVAAIEARGGARLDGLQVLFWKIHTFDVSLVPEGEYRSEWIGGKGGHPSLHPLGANGRPVIGISGASAEDVDSLGLIYCQKH